MTRPVFLLVLIFLLPATVSAANICSVDIGTPQFEVVNDGGTPIFQADGDGDVYIPAPAYGSPSGTDIFTVDAGGFPTYIGADAFNLAGSTFSGLGGVSTSIYNLVIRGNSGQTLAIFDGFDGDLHAAGEIVHQGAQANCLADGWYLGGDSGSCGAFLNDTEEENRDYYCDTSTSGCTHTVISTNDCDYLDKWYAGGDIGPGCLQMNDPEAEYYDYYSSGGTCTTDIPGDRCATNDCDGQDGWYGGGNTPGCGTDPNSTERDYNANGASCTYRTVNCGTADYDYLDQCGGTCNTISGDIQELDYFVQTDTDTQGSAWGSTTENCVDQCNDLGTTTTDEDLCGGGDTSCPSTTFTDYCPSTSTYRSYSCAGNDATSTDIDRDSSQTYCEATIGSCTAQTWFSDLGTFTGSSTACCGDDGSGDDFATFSGSLTTSTTVDCRSCSDGSDDGTTTLLGNGYLDDGADECYYGDVACSSTGGSDGASESCPDSDLSGFTCQYNDICVDGSGCDYSNTCDTEPYCSGSMLNENISCGPGGCGSPDTFDCSSLGGSASETDGGEVYGTYGECTSGGTGSCDDSGAGASCQVSGGSTSADSCGAGNELTEYYLSGSSCVSTVYDCDNDDVSAVDGDSGMDIFDSSQCNGGTDASCGGGECTSTSYVDILDTCTGDILNEAVESGFQCVHNTYDCNDLDTNASDGDGGIDYDTQATCIQGDNGQCSGGRCEIVGSGSSTDFCYGDGVTLREYYADGISCNYQEHTCPYGCSGGECQACTPGCTTNTVTCSAGTSITNDTLVYDYGSTPSDPCEDLIIDRFGSLSDADAACDSVADSTSIASCDGTDMTCSGGTSVNYDTGTYAGCYLGGMASTELWMKCDYSLSSDTDYQAAYTQTCP